MPYLRRGSPVGARAHLQLATHVVICQCSECVSSGTAIAQDGLSGDIVPGRLMGFNEYREHCARMKASNVSEKQAFSEPPKVPCALTAECPAAPSTVIFHTSRTERPLVFVTPEECNSSQDRDFFQELVDITAQAQTRRAALPPAVNMSFEHPPSHRRSQHPQTAVQSSRSGDVSLSPDHFSNEPFLEHDRWLQENIADLTRHPHSARCNEVLDLLRREREAFQRMKEEEWLRRDAMLERACEFYQDGGTVVDTGDYLRKAPIAGQVLRYACHVLVAALHLLCSLSVDHSHFVALMLQLILDLHNSNPSPNPSLPPVRVPETARRILVPLNLEPTTHDYVCCPKCYACYPASNIPEICSHAETRTSAACAHPLRSPCRRKGQIRNPPSRRFLYHDFKAWVGRLMCRPGMEKFLDRDVTENPPDGVMKDIWDGKVLRDFRGPDGRPFTQKRHFSDGRLVFSMNMDNFNPFFTRAGGTTTSSGAVYLVCLNLPPSLRHRLENMFLACVIPGPHKPSMWQINHLLRPLIDDLLVFWKPGVYYTRTHSFPKGRRVTCAVVPLVCDLPAARQMAGQAPPSAAHFCQFCNLSLSQIDNLNMAVWGTRLTKEEHLKFAMDWRDAPTEAERQLRYKAHGVWYSELLRLPYWDPTRYVVIDTMHNLLLGIIKYHCEHLWGMDATAEEGDGRAMPPKPVHRTVGYDQLRLAWNDLQRGKEEDLRNMPQYVLRALCSRAGLGVGGRLDQLIRKLLDYRIERGWADRQGDPANPDPALHPVPGSAVTERELERAQILLSSSSKYSLSKIRGEALKGLLSRHSLASGIQVDWTSLTRKSHVVDALYAMQTRSERGGYGHLASVHGTQLNRPARTVVLGRRTLSQVQRDMANMVLPSWIGRVPKDLGDTRHGALSADQWRSAATVIFMVALPHIWQEPGEERDQTRMAQMLDNFLDLVHAVRIATARTLTPARIEQFHIFMHQYLVGVQDLYRDATMRPNHHLSLHLREVFYDFGPSHSWRCFAFERYNSVLQHINTSGKSGEMEATMLQRCCMLQNLRALVDNAELPSALSRANSAFACVFGDHNRGTLLNDALALGESRIVQSEQGARRKLLTHEIYRLLCARMNVHEESPHAPLYEAMHLTTVTRSGVKFTIVDISEGDSSIVFGNINGEWRAGRISTIFTSDDTPNMRSHKIFVVVKPFSKLSSDDARSDPFYRLRRSKVSGRLHYSRLMEPPMLLELADIVCHCVCTTMSIPSIAQECMHILPLDRD